MLLKPNLYSTLPGITGCLLKGDDPVSFIPVSMSEPSKRRRIAKINKVKNVIELIRKTRSQNPGADDDLIITIILRRKGHSMNSASLRSIMKVMRECGNNNREDLNVIC